MIKDFLLFSGNSNSDFANKIVESLQKRGLEHFALGRATVSQFRDGETNVKLDENVKGKEVFIVQSTCTPVNHNYMELFIIIDAVVRAEPGKVIAVIPYFGYGRQDRKPAPRTPISAKLMADLLKTAGINTIITMDLHAGQIQGFFEKPVAVQHIYARPVIIGFLEKHLGECLSMDKAVIVSPDAGGTDRARSYAKRLKISLALIDKRRDQPGVSRALNLIGDVRDKDAVIIDDMVDTGGTLCEAADLLIDRGAVSVHAVCVHPVLSDGAVEKINASKIKTLIVADTIPLNEGAKKCPKIQVISVADLFAEVILRVNRKDTVSSLFEVK